MTTTIIEARQARPLNLSSCAHITAVPMLEFDSTRLVFDGALTAAEVGDVWWFVTSRDAADETARRALWTTRNDPATPACCVQTIDYMLGDVP